DLLDHIGVGCDGLVDGGLERPGVLDDLESAGVHHLGGFALTGHDSGQDVLGQFVVELALVDELHQSGDLPGGDDLGGVLLGLVGQAGDLTGPPFACRRRLRSGGDGVLDGFEEAGVDDVAHLEVGELPLAEKTAALLRRQLGQRGPQLFDPLAGRLQRHEIRLREVAVVVGVGLRTPRGGLPDSSWKCLVSWTIFSPASSRVAWRAISKRTARSIERKELTFFVSVRVPSGASGLSRRETLTSARTLPCSIRASETPRARKLSRWVRA